MKMLMEFILGTAVLMGLLFAAGCIVVFFTNTIVFTLTLAVFGFFAVKFWWDERR